MAGREQDEREMEHDLGIVAVLFVQGFFELWPGGEDFWPIVADAQQRLFFVEDKGDVG